jgi:hypothetical protein
VQDAEASWPCDKTTILNHIVESAHPNSEPPTEHANYDKMNSAVQGLFRGAALFGHASSGSAQGLRDLLSGGTTGIDYQDGTFGCTPAFMSAWNGHTDCLQLLANSKAVLNQPNNHGCTPAFASAQDGHTECLQLLLDCKADLNQPDNNGATPALESASKGHTDCLQLLADCKADLNQPDNNSRTPAYMSAKEGQTASIQVLINHKADTNQECQGYTPLKLAEEFGHSAIVEILLAAGAG